MREETPVLVQELAAGKIPSTIQQGRALRFWCVVVAVGVLTGLSAGLLTYLLQYVQRKMWGGNGTDLLAAASVSPPLRCVLVLGAAGALTGLGQFVLRRLSSGNGIDTTAAIWFHAGRLPKLRTLGSAVLSVIAVGMGVSLGREGAPKQAGAVFANWCCDLARLPDEQRRLLVACGAGAGMAAAYGVPLGGALFSLEVMRGVLALRYILPALFSSLVATAVAWTMLPDQATYTIPAFRTTAWVLPFAVLCGVLTGYLAAVFVRLVTWAERNKPSQWKRFLVPVVGMTMLGLVAVRYPELLGNGKDLAQLLFNNSVPAGLIGALALLKPAAVLLCLRCGVPGGMFTPSLTSGALIGSGLGWLCALAVPGLPVGLCALLGAGAFVAATTQGPISAVVLLMELTGRDRSFVLPLLLAVTAATLVARSIEPRSIYDARLTDEEIEIRQALRDKVQIGPEAGKEAE